MLKMTCQAISGAVDLTVAKLSFSHRVQHACQVLAQQGCPGLPLFSHSLRGKNSLRPDGGALESEETGPLRLKLLLFSYL